MSRFPDAAASQLNGKTEHKCVHRLFFPVHQTFALQVHRLYQPKPKTNKASMHPCNILDAYHQLPEEWIEVRLDSFCFAQLVQKQIGAGLAGFLAACICAAQCFGIPDLSLRFQSVCIWKEVCREGWKSSPFFLAGLRCKSALNSFWNWPWPSKEVWRVSN